MKNIKIVGLNKIKVEVPLDRLDVFVRDLLKPKKSKRKQRVLIATSDQGVLTIGHVNCRCTNISIFQEL